MILYLVKNGIKGAGCVVNNNKQEFGTNFHLITYDFKTNEGYIDKKGENYWRLYTQVGLIPGNGRYHKFTTFKKCVEKLKALKGDDKILICKVEEIENFE